MNLITITIDLDTHAIVPIEATVEMKLSCVYMQVHSAIEEEWANMLAAAPSYQSEDVLNMVWIPVSERLPEIDCFADITLKSYKNKDYSERKTNVFFNDSKWSLTFLYGEYVSHWMYIPAAPKGEELPNLLKNQVDIFGK